MPEEQLKRERTRSHDMNRMDRYVVHTPGYVNHSVFLFRSVGGTVLTYIFSSPSLTNNQLNLSSSSLLTHYLHLFAFSLSFFLSLLL